MEMTDVRQQWGEHGIRLGALEAHIADALESATETMLAMAGVGPGAQRVDLACGAGSQTLRAAPAVSEYTGTSSASASRADAAVRPRQSGLTPIPFS